jgi:hypothetical protein
MPGGMLTCLFPPFSRGSSLWAVQALLHTSATQQRAQCSVQSATSWSGGHCGLSSAFSSHTSSPCSHVPTTVAARFSWPTSPCESQSTVMRHLCCRHLLVHHQRCHLHYASCLACPVQGIPSCLGVLRLLITTSASCATHEAMTHRPATLPVCTGARPC